MQLVLLFIKIGHPGCLSFKFDNGVLKVPASKIICVNSIRIYDDVLETRFHVCTSLLV